VILSASRRKKYVELALHVATWSKDPTTQVGAVLVGQDPRDLCIGYNGFPPGIADDERLLDRPTKHMLMQHAERNALDNAKFDTRASLLVTSRWPCHECAKSIISKGITGIVCPPMTGGVVDDAWKKSSECARDLLKEANVDVLTVLFETGPLAGAVALDW
jgi:dCMP deaminase